MSPQATEEVRSFAREGILRDGSSIHIRAIRPDDRGRLLDHFRRLSDRAVYYRFFGSKKSLSEEELRRFTELDFVRHVGLAATLGTGDDERFIGVGRYIASDDRAAGAPRRAEVAFAVLDEYQGRGIGTLLLEYLVRLARRNGITEIVADALGDNRQMLEVFARSGFTMTRSMEAGVVHVSFPTEETPASLGASLERERQAAARSIRPFLNARSVALIGASRREGTIGNAILRNLKQAGFKGPIYPVNPDAAEIEGLRCHHAVGEIGAPVDLAIVAVPASAVERAVSECARAEVKGVVVISSGFAEASEEGRAAQRRLKHLVRASGMRMVGPNCMGILNTDPDVSLNATFSPYWPAAGNIGMLSQSGALGLAILEATRTRRIGISTFVSVGNKGDVSGNDLLAYWSEDPRTEVIVLYLESFGNPRKFARLAPEVARKKPIVAMKSGRSAAGSRAASSHSAALANLDVAVDALFEQAGVIRTNTLEELFDVVALLSNEPVPAGRRLGVVTNAGGPGILLADTCEAKGLALPELSAATLDVLRGFLPAHAGLANPIDMTASASPEDYARSLEAVGNDPAVDAVIVMYIPPMVTKPEEIAAAIADAAGRVPPDKPVLTVLLSSREIPETLDRGPRGRLPCYAFPENAAIALASAARYAEWRRRPRGTTLELATTARDRIRAIVDRVLEGADGPRWLEPQHVAEVLAATGIRLATTERALPAEAAATAARIGFPVVAKAISPDVVHKSDVGGVILGLDSPQAVEAAVETLRERMEAIGARLEGVLLQPEVRGGIEAIVGVTRDPTFGPLVVCGLGGVLVEVLADVSFRLTPVTDVDAAEMIGRLRSQKLLDGYRGAPPGDRAALADVIGRISALVEIVPELHELDLNPVKVLPPGSGAVVLDARIRVGRPEPAPV